MPRALLATLVVALALHPAFARQAKPIREFKGAKAPIRTVVLSADGKSVAAGSTADEVLIWDVARGKQTHRLVGGGGWSMACAFAPDGKSIATTGASGGILPVWNLPKGEKRFTLDRDPGGTVHVAFSPDGKLIASVGGEARVWDAVTGKLVRNLGRMRSGLSVAFSPDGKSLVTSDHGYSTTLWDVASGKSVWVWRKGLIPGLAFSPDGRRLYFGDAEGKIYEIDPARGTALRSWTTRGRGNARTLSMSPDGRTLAVSTHHQTAQLWEVSTLGLRHSIRADGGFCWSVAFAPDGKSIATGGDDCVARIWDVTAGWAAPDADGKKPRTDAQLESYWKALGGKPDEAYSASWALSAHGKQSVPFLAKKLKAVQGPLTARQLARLIEQLDDEEFEVREGATKQLANAGVAARQALQGALKGDLTLEQKRRIGGLLARLANVAPTPAETLRFRSVEVLERIGTRESLELRRTLPE